MKILTLVVTDEGVSISTNATEEEANSIILNVASQIIQEDAKEAGETEE